MIFFVFLAFFWGVFMGAKTTRIESQKKERERERREEREGEKEEKRERERKKPFASE